MDAVGDHNHVVMTYWDTVRHMEVGVVNLLSGRHAHGRMIESAAEVDFLAGGVFELNKRIIGRHLRIVAVGHRLRQPVQLASAKLVSALATQ